MKTLKIHSISGLVAVLMILLASSVNAQIILKSSSDPMDKLTRCNNWWECYKQQIDKEVAPKPLTIVPIPPPVVEATPLQLPNLIPTDVDARFYGSSLQIKAQVDNIGDAKVITDSIPLVNIDRCRLSRPLALREVCFRVASGRKFP